MHPRIKKVSHNMGYTTGSQELKISGVSLNGTNIEVEVGGVDCEIIDSGLDYIKCVTGVADVASPLGY